MHLFICKTKYFDGVDIMKLKNMFEIKNKIHIKDVFIYGMLTILIIYLGYKDFKFSSEGEFLDRLSGYIGSVLIILFGVVGLFEFAYDNGLTLMLPVSFIDYKKKNIKKQMKYYIENYLKEELHIINQYNNERISFFLSQLGLSQYDFELLKEQLVSIKMMPLSSISDAEEKMIKIISSGNILFKQNTCESKKLVYKEVQYFVNFIDIMYIREYNDELSDCLIMLLREKLRLELNDINKIIIPHSGNRMLGVSIGQKLGKAIINVTEKAHIFEDQCWEGHFDDSRKNYGIIVHDVLVTGKQIIESIDKIKEHCIVKYVFCLINRVDMDDCGTKALEDKGIKVFSLINLSDSDAEYLYNNWRE